MDPGTRVGERFVIEAEVAAGGMGTVYRAVDVTSGDVVAIKILRDRSAEARSRLDREARALAECSHPHVVRYVAHGGLESGASYLAMEWIAGETLSERLQRAPLTTSQALGLIRRLADALGHVHARGLVHRDVKPGNVVLRDGELDAPTLVDFGLVRLDAEVSITGTGTVVGTPSYMSPEQARGERDIGPPTDVFALGCVLFRCITGRSAFAAADGLAVLAKVLLDDPPRAISLVPDLDPRVDDVIHRMLVKDADARPRDGAAVVSILDALGEVVDATPPGQEPKSPTRLGEGERKLRTVVIAATRFDPDATLPRSSALLLHIQQRLVRFGARSDILASGATVITMTGGDSAKEHAVRAAACALDLAEIVPDPIAVATGQTESNDHDHRSASESDVFDRAARLLRGASERSSIRIDETTAALLGEGFVVVQTPDALELRGRVTGDELPRTLLGRATPFVGRDRELLTLEAIFDECVRESAARIVLVTGLPGLGKSRLRRELVQRIRGRSRALVLAGAVDPLTRGAPFAVLGRALATHAGITASDGPEVGRAKLVDCARRVIPSSSADRAAEFLGVLCAIDIGVPSSRRAASRHDPVLLHDHVRRSFVEFLSAACDAGPVVLVLDDLQWIDALTPKLIDSTVSALAERPLMVVGLARSEIAETMPGLWSERGVIPLPLSGIPRRAASELVFAVLPELAPATADRIVARAAGNPHYLEELIRSEAAGRHGEAPETVLAMVQSRIADLDVESRRLLRGVSILGPSFTDAAVHALFAEDGEPVTASRLAHLARRDFLVRSAEGWAFRNDLVREVAYGMLTEADARLGHRLAGDFLAAEPRYDAVAVAEHYVRSDEPMRAIDPLIHAAQLALDASDFRRALELAARARDVGSNDGTGALIEAEAHRWLGETEKAYAAATAAARLIGPDDPRRLDVLRALAYGASYIGRVDELDAVSDELMAYQPGADDLRPWLFAVSQAATSLIIVGKAGLGDRLLARAAPFYEGCADDPAISARFLEARVALAAHAGDFELLLDAANRARANAESAGNDRAAIVQTINVGFAWMQLGDYVESLAAFERARTESGWLGLVSNRRSAIQNEGYALLRLGRLEEARALELAILAEIGRDASTRLVTLTHACLASLEVRAGDLARAARHARAAVAAATGLPQAAYAETVSAEVALAEGDAAGALATAERALATMRRAGGHHFAEATALLVRARALDGLGRREEARQVIQGAAAIVEARAAKLGEARRAKFLAIEEHRQTLDLAREWT